MTARGAKKRPRSRSGDAVSLLKRLRQAERRLRQVEERHELMMGAVREGVYDWDVTKDTVYYSERVHSYLGLPPDTLKSTSDWVERIHPDDLPAFRAAYRAHFKGLTPRFECDYRFRAANGSWRWARTHGVAIRDRSGRAVRMVGSSGDITELKEREHEVSRAEAALKTSEQRYELATSAALAGIYEWDIERDALFLTERARAFFSFTAEKLTPADWNSRVHPDDFEGYRQALRQYFRRRTSHLEYEYRIADGQGGYRWVLDRGIGVRDAKGQWTKLIGALNDITARKHAENELRRARDVAEEALAERTATAETLRVVAQLQTDVQPVFDAIVRNAARLCGALIGGVYRFDGEMLHLVATHNFTPEALAVARATFPMRPDRSQLSARAVLTGAVQRLEDVSLDADYAQHVATAGGWRRVLSVPMLRESKPLGVISVAWRDPGPIPERQVELLKTFADQAVIAIEDARLVNETKEALEQQTATAEILRVTSGSPTDVQPVFEAIVSNASRLCQASFASVFLYDGEVLRSVAQRNASPQFEQFLATSRPRPSRETTTRRCALERRTIHTADLLNDPEFDPPEHQRRENVRTALSVPMIREGALVGVITLWRAEVRPFTDKQIELIQTFADQAAIAIENVRLFNETKEALDQQKALAEVLGAISGSIADAKPVFNKILDSCQRLFEGHLVGLTRAGEDGLVHLDAYKGDNREEIERVYPYPIARDSGSGQAMLDRKVVRFANIGAPGSDAPAQVVRGAHAVGAKSIIFAPLLAEGRAIGALWVARRAPGPFSDKQAALLKTFADQAVIAIQNARLFNETREALEQQTATADILKVISRSLTDTQPVFDAIARSAVQLCDGADCSLFRFDGRLQNFAAHYGVGVETVDEIRRRYPLPPQPGRIGGRAVLERTVIHVADVLADPRFPDTADTFKRAGYRAALAVPMLKEGEPTGVIVIVRREARRFTDRQIELLRTFADQAVIAIEDVRLVNETKEALEQQRASAEVLQAISSSIADTAPVFDKILESCERLFAGRIVGLNLVREDGMLHLGAYHGAHRAEFERIFPLPLSSESGSGLSIVERRVVHYPDTEHGESVPAKTRQGCRTIGIKSALFAPVLWEGRGLGAIFVGRDRVSSFSEKEIALLRTFADQAAIAIENVRLFNEIEEKSQQLEVANRHKSEFLANMSHELRTPLNAIIGFARIVMRRSRGELDPKQYENLEKILASGQHLLALINAILDLAKVEAGHVEVNPNDIALAPVLEQCLRTVEPLVKAEAVTLVREFDEALPQMYVDDQKLRQIVINLLSNAAKFTARGSIRLQAQAANGAVAITVADTGIGIPADKLELVFEEFEQLDASSTRAYGGTGLGLAIARRLARLMGGDIRAESVIGAGSTFTLTLPTRYASLEA